MGVLGQDGLAEVWFDRLTRDARCGLVVGCRWVPAADGRLTAGAVAEGAEWVQPGARRGTGVRRAGEATAMHLGRQVATLDPDMQRLGCECEYSFITVILE